MSMEKLTGKLRYVLEDCIDCISPIQQEVINKSVDRLAAYEATGLEPEEVNAIAGLASENCAKVADKIDQLLSDDKELEQYRALGPIDRLRELKQADDEGRCVVLPSDDYTWTIRGDIVRGIIEANCWAAKKEAEAALRREQE